MREALGSPTHPAQQKPCVTILPLKRQRQKDQEFKIIYKYIVFETSLKKKMGRRKMATKLHPWLP